MTSVEERLRDECRRLLENKEVDVILGYQRGTLPLRSAPLFARKPEDVERMIWDETCENSVSVYIPRLKGSRVGIVAKGCDGRWVVEYITENQVSRSALKVIGVPCDGVLSRKALERAAGPRSIMEGHLEDGHVVLKGRGWQERVPIQEVLEPSCKTCVQKSSPIIDLDLGRVESPNPKGDFGDVAAVEAREVDERWDIFVQEASKCIRCYACRQACPGCYCKVCFVDRSKPTWVGGTDDLTDAMVFHIMRAMHLAGRCVDCGACEKACPAGVNLRLLNRKLERDARELYGHVAGLRVDDKPMLSTFRPNDPGDFIM